MTEEKKYRAIRKKILNWYDRNHYDYPWRKTSDLYKILITEILLQKTIASNVQNIFDDFFKKYPDFSHILEVDISELQSDIKRLGLSNKRSQILKDLSHMILNEYKGKIPDDADALKKINGIADYVSNAYLCFGLNKRTFFYDVNIKRFVSRIFTFPDSKVSSVDIEENLDKLLPESDCKFLYWAILDFGNKICIKKNPKCNECPISLHCNYYSNT